ncbi:TPA: hypothetical protein ACXE8V_001093 [Pluralibacter gergoviae]
MTSREKFEAWWEEFYEDTPMEPWDELYSPENDFYFDQIIDGQYDAWKASRDEEIELPAGIDSREALTRGFMIDYSAGMDQGIVDCAAAIRDAGFKVKGG